ncbi:MAG: RNA polymerase sigma factor [Steroidobacter sp.]
MAEPEESTDISLQNSIAAIYRNESRKVFATLIRLLGNFDAAEEALHEAFRAAVEQWPREGMPANPVAWLVSAGRFKAIDNQRRQKRFTSTDELGERAGIIEDESVHDNEQVLEDDRLRLIFTCCHPSLAEDAQVALTLREICGLTTEEIARAYLIPASTLAQRIVRAKSKIQDARIPYEVPERETLHERLASVLRVIYLVFNEGYSASSGESLTRHPLSEEAIRLARLLHELLPEPEVGGLLALMVLHESRRASRTNLRGDLIPLEDQDRRVWNRAMITEGIALVEQSLRSGRFGPYSIQAAISAVHAEAARYDETDWMQIVGLYDVLMQMEPSPVVALNRAVAVAMRDGYEHGLELVNELLNDKVLQNYHLAHAARADLCRRLNRKDEARISYERALQLTKQEPERRFIEWRLSQLGC